MVAAGNDDPAWSYRRRSASPRCRRTGACYDERVDVTADGVRRRAHQARAGRRAAAGRRGVPGHERLNGRRACERQATAIGWEINH